MFINKLTNKLRKCFLLLPPGRPLSAHHLSIAGIMIARVGCRHCGFGYEIYELRTYKHMYIHLSRARNCWEQHFATIYWIVCIYTRYIWYILVYATNNLAYEYVRMSINILTCTQILSAARFFPVHCIFWHFFDNRKLFAVNL